MTITLPPADGPFDGEKLGDLRVWALAISNTPADKFKLSNDERQTVQDVCGPASKALHPEATIAAIGEKARSWFSVEKAFQQTTLDTRDFARKSLTAIKKAPELKKVELRKLFEVLRDSTREYEVRAQDCAKQLKAYRVGLGNAQNDLISIHKDFGKTVEGICSKNGHGGKTLADVQSEIQQLKNQLDDLRNEVNAARDRTIVFAAFSFLLTPLLIGAAVNLEEVTRKAKLIYGKIEVLKNANDKVTRYSLAETSLQTHDRDITALCSKVEVAEKAASSLAATWGHVTNEFSQLLVKEGGLDSFEDLPEVFAPEAAYDNILARAQELLDVLALEPISAAA